jgi:small subunit ribosomal protein S28e
MAEEETKKAKVEEKDVEVKAEAEKKVEEPKEEVKESKKPEEAKQEAPKEAKETKAEKETPKESKPKEEPKAEKSKSTASVEGAVPAQVVKVFKKVGLYGESYQVLARILEGRDQGNLLRRNVRGPVKENDILMLKETERDVRAV